MTTANIKDSLNAVERALSHFRDNLDRAGFGEGADTYKQMTDVVVGQFFWSLDNGDEADLERFATTVDLARAIHAHLQPYVWCMERIGALNELLTGEEDPDTDHVVSRIETALLEAGRPMSASAVARVVEDTVPNVRKKLDDLIARDIVSKVRSGSRPMYELKPVE